ncbi:CooT family nickel-binding protein [Lacrimispora sp. NSJ-141]|uniref:CooT family nickel-binding protein n=1 Tax=Lientehia hominis TaxID=2897778 RepID=A0AAP2W8X7_9FIRM|nr:CooT family nickel-binding protein [Lientehia hominis]MCD2492715.1 CooT family nickel-binding protein [Lientehia hominis]
MCLAAVYGKRPEEDETLLLKNVSKILIDGDVITMYDIIGKEMKIKGALTEVDLAGSIVKVRCTD